MDGGGTIEGNELHNLLEGLGIKVTEEEAEDLVNEVDADGSGVIEFEEFVFLMQRFLGVRRIPESSLCVAQNHPPRHLSPSP